MQQYVTYRMKWSCDMLLARWRNLTVCYIPDDGLLRYVPDFKIGALIHITFIRYNTVPGIRIILYVTYRMIRLADLLHFPKPNNYSVFCEYLLNGYFDFKTDFMLEFLIFFCKIWYIILLFKSKFSGWYFSSQDFCSHLPLDPILNKVRYCKII